VVPLVAPDVVLSVVGGLHERVHSSRRLRDSMAVHQTGAATCRAAMKTRRRKTPKLKRRKEPTATHRHRSSAADLQKQLDQRTRELAESQRQLAEALEQQTATTQILASLEGNVARVAKVAFVCALIETPRSRAANSEVPEGY
jgi:hypothetical protein